MLQSGHMASIIHRMTQRLPPSASSFDLMLRRGVNIYVPAIFINRSLPGILSCISRELEVLHCELRLIHKSSGRMQPSRVGPLANWYQSIFEGIFLDIPLEKWICENNLQNSAGFSFPAAASLPMPFSYYQYVCLTLPPLWNKEPDCILDDMRAGFGFCIPGMKSSRNMLCHFRYEKTSGVWFASLESSARKKESSQDLHLRKILMSPEIMREVENLT